MGRFRIVDSSSCFHNEKGRDFLQYNSKTNTARCVKCGEVFEVIDLKDMDECMINLQKDLSFLSDLINTIKFASGPNINTEAVVELTKMTEAIDILDIDKLIGYINAVNTRLEVPQSPSLFGNLNSVFPTNANIGYGYNESNNTDKELHIEMPSFSSGDTTDKQKGPDLTKGLSEEVRKLMSGEDKESKEEE